MVILMCVYFSLLIATNGYNYFESLKSKAKFHVPLMTAPHHVAFIVDGNGRWATSRGLPRIDGHINGANTTVEIVKRAFELDVRCITLYLFSTENWGRPREEVDNIMQLLEKYLINFSQYLKANKIALKAIGQLYKLPHSVKTLINNVGYSGNDIEQSRTLCLAISYGGRDDIIQTCKKLIKLAAENEISEASITEELFSRFTSSGQLGISDPDLIVRTSGEFRLSNFYLWQSAYTEFATVEKNWPDFTVADLSNVLATFQQRERRFGAIASGNEGI